MKSIRKFLLHRVARKGLAVLLALLVLGACKGDSLSNQVVGMALVIGDRVPVLAAPIRTGVVLATFGRNKTLEIVKKAIPDQKYGKKTFWYGVKLEKGKFGYLSYDEEILRGNIASFEPVTGDIKYGLVMARNVRLRKKPSLRVAGRIVVNPGDLVEVVRRGVVPQRLGKKKKDFWMEVKTKSGQTGYTLASFLEVGKEGDVKKIAEGGLSDSDGWVLLKGKKLRYYDIPGVTAYKNNEYIDDRCGELPGGGKIVEVNASKTVGAKTYYSFERGGSLSENEEMQRGYGELCAASVWVEGSETNYIENFYEYSKKSGPSELDTKLLAAVYAEVGKELNAAKTKYHAETPAGDNSGGAKKFHILNVVRGPAETSTNTTMLLLEENGEFEVLKEFGEYEGISLNDIDGDGKPELISEASERAETTTTFYALGGGSLREVFSFSNFDSENGDDFEAYHKVEKPYILLLNLSGRKKYPFDSRFKGRKYRAFKVENSVFKEVDAKKIGVDFKKKFSDYER